MKQMKLSIQNLQPYKASPYNSSIRLHANETTNYLYPNGYPMIEDLSLYPDSNASKLQENIASLYNLNANQIIIGNGSSEVIDIAMKTYLEQGDIVLSFSPTFVMYTIYALEHNAKVKTVQANKNFTQPVNKMIQAIKKYNPAITILCTPNNPTGNKIPKDDVLKIVQASNGLVIVDEAYMEFSDENTSVISKVNTYDNLLVLRTFSKAYGLAAIRVGYGISNNVIIKQLLTVKPPYNVNSMSQLVASDALLKQHTIKQFTKDLQTRREYFYEKLQTLPIKVYPSQGNFIYCYIEKQNIFDELIKRDILIRKYKGSNQGYYRITIGSTKENTIVYNALKEVLT